MIFSSKDELKKILDDKKYIYIAGAGTMGEVYGKYLDSNGVLWNGFLDKDDLKDTLSGKRVFKYNEIDIKDIYVLISSYFHIDNILLELKRLGLKDDRIFIPNSQQVGLDLLDDVYGVYDSLDNIKKYAQKYKGERCFIIGNGPSLAISDLEKLKEEVTFASNSIYALYDFTHWRPTYYSFTDPITLKILKKNDNMKRVAEGCDSIFLGLTKYLQIVKNDLLLDNMLFFNTVSGIIQDDKMIFSNDASKVLYTGGTVTYVLLQLAAYMGFSEIYLLGVDFSYSVEEKRDGTVSLNDVTNHNIYIEKEESKYYSLIRNEFGYNYVAYIDKQLCCYQTAKKYADTHGIKIYNATRGGKLEVFERVDFDSLF